MAPPPTSDDNAGLVARERQGDNAQPLTISEISALLKRTVEDRFGYVRLRGELSGVKRAASGHFYCALKDEGAVLDGVMWKGNAARLNFRAEDGLEVIATGKLTTYPGRSKYQIVIDSLELAGEGALLALLEKTRARLAAEGLFDAGRKRALPFLPRVIGVVTSPTGAVIRDILHRLADRFPSHVLVWPVLVQGNGAAEQVAAAVRGFSAIAPGGPVPRPDVVIVARGGGSIEDLWSFNEEVVVRAIAECTIPVISAVGHETDTTLADFAADRRAPTPTAAAEMAVPVRADLAFTLTDLAARQRRAVYRPVELGRERLAARARLLPRPENLLQPQAQRLDDLSERLRRALGDRSAKGRERLAGVAARLSPSLLTRSAAEAQRRLDRARLTPSLVERPLRQGSDRLAALTRVMSQLHPEKPLERGYAIIRSSEGKALTTRAEAVDEALLTVQFRDGTLTVAPGETPPPPSPRPAPKPRPAAPPRQDDLFG
ncbi:exodeoxyribonuclease VII large subunit [Porphyrobacter sp. HT-58-2]|uniref:exodeoxyribonuclease VII large subunit n=1 Tax=Porphyrobacter sp. HT-58-2 TaxID=2023229 RepID=UPI000CDBC1CA|nr:exodeoxyribonuclease VII large subunit [Porphyrobacter sp. HT-58-2]AUX68590.1 exodeoxyribonuclease VII large subunit [Porphyrobacter sp. HT-58-2]